MTRTRCGICRLLGNIDIEVCSDHSDGCCFNAGKYAPYVGDEARIDIAIEVIKE